MTFFDDIFEVLPQIADRHKPTDPMWRVLRTAAHGVCADAFSKGEPVSFGPFGEIAFPYFKMGAIDSIDLFGLDELIIFSFYNRNRTRYRKVVDFGANIGLHSIILSRCGFEVRSFEPDPKHARRFESNAALNGVKPELHEAAVSFEAGETQFVRVVGNTTGSHIKGAKSNPYGDLETFDVTVEAAGPHLAWADLAKIDIEGHEAELVRHLPPETWTKTDAIMEVGTEENAGLIFDYLGKSEARMFSQKTGWKRVAKVSDMPFSHREGSLFLTGKDAMPWD
jgi:FkbM family methyltransferase